ncbi:hypothetical protein TrRE_jg5755 [Triparma retinervis]|uniref:asparagine--tRNA ligase n=1 Tax=Triparma retinervis TaxID=2557542 RepID=A0A9W7AIZ6_9STRA|nr:hypothetical protein TrRE_jg5755 [Triparma retinervis]
MRLGTRALSTKTESATEGSQTQRALKIKNLVKFQDDLEGKEINIKGWVRTVRKQKTLTFVELNDGSSLSSCQVVVDHASLPEEIVKEAQSLQTGASISVVGALKESSGSKQKYDFQLSSMSLLGACPPEEYPLAKKRHSLEYLRTLAHIRPRTNTVAAVARVRSKLAQSIHRFFEEEEFFLVNTPVVTASDCEGAGEMFRVTTLDLDDVSSVPKKEGEGGAPGKGADYGEDFFGKPAYLTVSGQLSAETYACAMGDVYTFGPTFRAENSQTARHLAEFWMLEPEMAFTEKDGAMDNVENMLKFVIGRAMEDCDEDLTFFDKFYEKGLKDRLKKIQEQDFVRLSYRDAVQMLEEEINKDPSAWQFPEVVFGTDLQTEHERWLCEKKFSSPVFVYDYPTGIKAFYMRQNDADGGETVAAFDLLVPGVGELVGGSQREERLDVLLERLDKLGLEKEDYWWYLDLRRFGTVPHSGYGLGFERLVTFITGIDNIRDAIAFPRYPGSAEF